MGLSLHNSIAVFEGYIGKRTPFVRTPKFNIKSKADKWNENRYLTSAINPLTILEGILAFYFLGGVILGFYYGDFGFVAFHVMLFSGFAAVCFYSIKHAMFAKSP
jgi:hypothetical protein